LRGAPKNQMATTTRKKRNMLRLAVELGVSRTTLRMHLAKEGAPQKDADGLYDVEECRAWLQGSSNANVEGSEIRDLRAKKLRMEVEEMERENAVARGELVKKSEIAPAIIAFNETLASELEQIFAVELPQKYQGLDVIECRALNIAAIDRVMKALKEGQWPIVVR
jgi:hypothetical protein